MNQELVTKISSALRTKDEMQELAEQCKELQPAQYDEMLESLLETYDGPGVGNLLVISALNKISLDPETFVQSIMITDKMQPIHLSAVYQNKDATEYLIDYGYKWFHGMSGKSYWAMKIAIDLTCKYQLEEERFKIVKVLNFMVLSIRDKTGKKKFIVLKNLVEGNKSVSKNYDALNILPKQSQRENIPTSISRVTSPWQLGHIKLSSLSDNELIRFSQLTAKAGLMRKADEICTEILKRNKMEKFHDSLIDLLDHGLIYQDSNIVYRIAFNNPYDIREYFDNIFTDFFILNSFLEHRLRNGSDLDNFSIFEKLAVYHFPALCIFFSRAEIAVSIADEEKIKLIKTRIKESRILLGLDPESDPVNEIYNLFQMKNDYNKLEEEAEKLSIEVSDLEKAKSQLKTQLDEKSKTNKKLGKEVEELKLKVIGDKEYQMVKAERDMLFPRVEQLRMENKTYSNMIADLKGENRALREKVAELESTPADEAMPLERDESDDGEAVDINRMPKTFTIPIFEESFQNSLKRLDVALQRKAWDDSNGFAATRKDIWRKTCPLKGLKGYYRIKFDPSYRIIFKWENGDAMRFIEVIPRQDLETWIKNKS